MDNFCSGGVYASPNITKTEAEILNPLSQTAGAHMCLHVTLCSKGMLALSDNNSHFMWCSWCEGARTAQGFPISEKDQQGHHNADCPRDGAHGWASCDHIIC